MLTKSLVFRTIPHTPKYLSKTPVRFLSIASDIKKLRDELGSPIGECKKALEDFGGDLDKARQWLRDQGKVQADK